MWVGQSQQQLPNYVINRTVVNCPGTPGDNSSCGRCSYKYQKENATLSDGGIIPYHFYKNNESMIFTTVHVIEKPSAAEILKLSVSDQFVMTVEFKKGNFGDWTPDFKVYMSYRNKVTSLCSMNSSSCQDTCICKYESPTPSINNYPVTLSVDTFIPENDRPVQNASWSGNFSLFQHIVPSQVKDLKLFNVGADDAVIMFRPSQELRLNIENMNRATKPLYYRINLTRTQGLSEVLTVEFKKTVFSTSAKPFQFVAVRLTNLTQFTCYSVSVAGVGGGGEGGATTLEFTTNKTEPLRPPRIGDFTYTRILGEHNTSSLHLLWQPLPLASRGGSSISYYLVVASSNGTILNETIVSSNYILLDGLPSRDPLTVKIWAENEMGRSNDYSQIKIPAYQDVQPPMYVEYDLQNNVSYVWLDMSGFGSVEMIAIHKCDVSLGSLCTTYPYTHIKAVNSLNGFDNGRLMFDMPLTTPVILTTVDVTREVTYFDTEDGGNPYQDPTGFTVYTNVSIQVDESDGLWDVPNKDDYPRIYLSVRVNGTWLGMARTKCYFNRNSATVDLVQYAELDGQRPYLRFIQHCDPEIPKQFLAERFIVYALTNDTINGRCDGPERRQVGEVNNEMFTFNSIDLPSGMRFACVEAVGYNTSTSQFSLAIPYEAAPVSQSAQVISETDLIITVIFSVFGGLAAVFIIFCMVYICWKRKAEIRKKFKCSDPDGEFTFRGSMRFKVRSIEEPSNARGGSSDSGRGTMNSNNQGGTTDGDNGRTDERKCSNSSDTSLLHVEANDENRDHSASYPSAPCGQSNNVTDEETDHHDHYNQSNNVTNEETDHLDQYNQSNNVTDEETDYYGQSNQSSCSSSKNTDDEDSKSNSSDSSDQQRTTLQILNFDFKPHVTSDSNTTSSS